MGSRRTGSLIRSWVDDGLEDLERVERDSQCSHHQAAHGLVPGDPLGTVDREHAADDVENALDDLFDRAREERDVDRTHGHEGQEADHRDVDTCDASPPRGILAQVIDPVSRDDHQNHTGEAHDEHDLQ